MVTTVVNLHHEPYDVYIGRKGKGQLGSFGNPFNDGTREENIENFERWVTTAGGRAAYIRNHLHLLYGKRLGCFCKPKACHGDVLAKMAEVQYGPPPR